MNQLIDLFCADVSHARDDIRAQLDRSGVVALLSGLPPVEDLTGQITDTIVGFLDVPLAGMLRSAIDQAPAVVRKCRETRGTAGATARMKLAKQTLQWNRHPTIELETNASTIPILELILTLTLELETLSVIVSEGRVTGFGDVTADSNGKLEVKALQETQTHVLASHELPTQVLVHAVQFPAVVA